MRYICSIYNLKLLYSLNIISVRTGIAHIPYSILVRIDALKQHYSIENSYLGIYRLIHLEYDKNISALLSLLGLGDCVA